MAAFQRASPDFQAKPGYEVDKPGKANMNIASNAVSVITVLRVICLVASAIITDFFASGCMTADCTHVVDSCYDNLSTVITSSCDC